MTLKDDEKFCIPCKKIGLERKAHRIMPSGGGRCDEHFRDEQGIPQLNDEGKRFIEMCKARAADPTAEQPKIPGKTVSDVPVKKPMRQKFDYKAMQADRDAGMRVMDIAKKYNCSMPLVSIHTKQRTDPPARGPYKKKKSAIANGDFSTTIADLKMKREDYLEKITSIDEVIEKLENLA